MFKKKTESTSFGTIAPYSAADSAFDALKRQNKSYAEDIDNIIDALGLRDAYPDVEGKRTTSHYESSSRRITTVDVPYTAFGRHKFLADVRLAVDASRGAEAAARLAAALKPKKN